MESLGSRSLNAYRNRMLRDLLCYAHRNVPYYRELFAHHGVKPADIRTIVDLGALPTLNKDRVRENQDLMHSVELRQRQAVAETTSGSTGEPLGFFLDPHVNAVGFALFWRTWNWYGYRLGQRWVDIRAHVFPNNGLSRYSRLLNCPGFSTYRIFDDLDESLTRLVGFSPRMIMGFPSVLCELAERTESDRRSSRLRPHVVVTLSEMLFDHQRERLQTFFKCPVYDIYHQQEHVCMIAECEQQTKHHLMEYGILELLGENGEPVADGETGEITATGFFNKSMPFIRYRTGDLATRHAAECPCGREHDAIGAIQGRVNEAVITPDGRRVHLLMSAIGDLHSLRSAQVVQSNPASVEFRYVPRPGFRECDLGSIDLALRAAIGRGLQIEYRMLDRIERQPGGKHPFVVCNLGQTRPSADAG